MANWMDTQVAFYDFIWAYGTEACTDCINEELWEDFKAGGDKFKQMKKKILEKWPTKAEAVSAFNKSEREASGNTETEVQADHPG